MWIQQIRDAQKNFTEMRFINKDGNVFEENNNFSQAPLDSITIQNGESDMTESSFNPSKRVLSAPLLTSTVDRFRQGRLRLFSIPHQQ